MERRRPEHKAVHGGHLRTTDVSNASRFTRLQLKEASATNSEANLGTDHEQRDDRKSLLEKTQKYTADRKRSRAEERAAEKTLKIGGSTEVPKVLELYAERILQMVTEAEEHQTRLAEKNKEEIGRRDQLEEMKEDMDAFSRTDRQNRVRHFPSHC
jgi:hypothetical protein